MSHITQFQHLKIQLQAILSATNQFSDDNCIGHGGFGSVYKGKLVLSMGKTMVALKRLDRAFGQGDSEFWKEIMTLSFFRHENIVSLLGYCDDHGEKILVYEYASNKSLDSYLACNDLTWVQRLKICIGAARGLAYLHAPPETQQRIVHRDVKTSNILLDNNWNAKISDFGLSKLAPASSQFTIMLSNPAGTLGYIDPLYQEEGILTKESDVYSFGVVMFEVLCGRLCFGGENLQPLIGLVREYYEENKISELVYGNIKHEINTSSLKLFVDTAYRCISKERKERPSMIEIMKTLVRALDIQENADEEAVYGDGILNLKVLRTEDDGNKNQFKVPDDSYLILNMGDRQTVKCGWDEVVTMYVEEFHHQWLYVYLNKVESVEKDHHLGMAIFRLSDLTPEIPINWSDMIWMNINGWSIGNIKVEVLYKALAYTRIPTITRSMQKAPAGTPKDGGLLVIIIHRADLSHGKHKHSSVTLLFRGESRKTPSMITAIKPIWLQEFTFILEQPPTDENLHLEVNDNSWMGLIPGKGSLGCVDISLADVISKKWTSETYTLTPGYKLGDGQYIYNSLKVELHWRTCD